MALTDHTPDCDWHMDQYERDCTCKFPVVRYAPGKTPWVETEPGKGHLVDFDCACKGCAEFRGEYSPDECDPDMPEAHTQERISAAYTLDRIAPVAVASDGSSTVLVTDQSREGRAFALAMLAGLSAGARPLPRKDLPPIAEQAAALDAILTAQRAKNLAEAQARKAAALDAGDRELAHACRIAIARAENEAEAA